MGIRAPERHHRVIERSKEVDHAHRHLATSSFFTTLGKIASLTLLRQLAHGLILRPWKRGASEVKRPAPGRDRVTFVGHATILLSTAISRLICDPMLGEFLWGFRRKEPSYLHPKDAQEVEVILLTHAHADRLHRKSLDRISKAAVVLVPPRCASLLADLGFKEVVEMEPGQTRSVAGFHITAVAARHDGRRGPWDWKWRGSLGYLVKTDASAIYIAGDTAYFSGFEDIGRRLRADLAVLPIAGYRPNGARDQHMSPLDAAQAFADLGARLFLPVAYGSFPMGYEPMDEPLAWLKKIAVTQGFEDRLTVLRPGESLDLAHQG